MGPSEWDRKAYYGSRCSLRQLRIECSSINKQENWNFQFLRLGQGTIHTCNSQYVHFIESLSTFLCTVNIYDHLFSDLSDLKGSINQSSISVKDCLQLETQAKNTLTLENIQVIRITNVFHPKIQIPELSKNKRKPILKSI